jgi:hypothetical protein
MQRAASLAEAWAARAAFWDGAYLLVLDNKYPGRLEDLADPELLLVRAGADLGFVPFRHRLRAGEHRTGPQKINSAAR